MELLALLAPFMRNFQMINEINHHLVESFTNAVNGVEEVVRGEMKPADVTEIKPFISMVTLSYLYRLLTETIVGANDESANRLLFRIFFKSWEPYLDILDKWLRSGTLMDKYSEFFIKHNKDINVLTNFYLKLNWNTDYVFQTYSVKWKLLNEVDFSIFLFTNLFIGEVLYMRSKLFVKICGHRCNNRQNDQNPGLFNPSGKSVLVP